MPPFLSILHRAGRAARGFAWPAPRGGDLVQTARERLLVLFALISGIAGLTTALSSLYLFPQQPVISSLGLAGALAIFAVPVYFHAGGAFVRSAWALILLFVAPILATVVPTGGLLAGSALYLVAAPVVAGLLLGLRAALAVGAAVVAAIVALYLARDQVGVPVHRMDPDAMSYSFAYAMAMLAAGLAVAVGTFHGVVEATSLALKRARDEAEAANEAKSQFLANMSHELRTPLNGILGFADLMSGTELPPQARDYLRHIQHAGGDLLSLVSDVLDFSRAEDGALVLEALPFDLHGLVAEMRERMLLRAAAKGLVLDTQLGPEVPRAVIGDPLRLRQVLGNLMDNAVKFTASGSVTLTVAARPLGEARAPGWPQPAGPPREPAPGELWELRFEVADTGTGIPPEALPHIFDRFTQADSSTTRRYGGSGLGLAIVRALAELMQGQVGVDSTPGRGSRFWATAAMPVAAALPPGRARAEAAPPRRTAHPGRVLLVEDSPTNQELYRAVLAGAGHVVEIAPNGQAALEALRRQVFDLVLMDGQMPVMGGIDAARAIRKSGAAFAQVPIVALTANAVIAEQQAYLAAGMDDYLAKPVDLNRMLAKVDQWIARRRPPAEGG